MRTFYDTLKIEENGCPPDCFICRERCEEVKKSKSARGKGIQAVHIPERNFHMAITCNQCAEPACIDVCPTGAITKNAMDGIVRITETKCVGCRLCDLACPYGGIHYNIEQKKASKCDFCEGDPQCIPACPEHLISLMKARPIMEYLHEDQFLMGSPLCSGCPAEQTLRFVMRVMGKETFLFGAPGCACLIISGMGTKSMCLVPSHLSNMTNCPSTMAGVKRYYRRIGKDVRCVAFVGDGCAADVGFQSLSGAAERNENIIFITYDNEGYMNTGIQRSSTTPYMGWTFTSPVGKERKGKQMVAKNLPLIMAAHQIPYVATATIGYPEDLVRKLTKAKAIKDGMSYIHLLSPCIPGWGIEISVGIEVCRAAVETNYFPLWECERGKYRLTYFLDKPKPIRGFIKMMRRFSHLDEKDIEEIQELANRRFAQIKALTELPGASL